MARLTNLTQNRLLTENLHVARTLRERTVGLLGKSSLPTDEMLWILRCNSIHTFFMKFSIDCIFINKQMLVCAIRRNIRPWRLVLPVFRAQSVIEMSAGQAHQLNLQLGDQLHVGH